MHLRDRRDRQPLEAIDDGFHPPLVRDAVLAGGELGELPDVGARDEGVAGGAKHEHADARRILDLLFDLVAGAGQRVVHRPRHGVARLGPIERQERDWTVGCEQHLRSGHGYLTGRGTMSTGRTALEGIRVLDVTQVMAGPFCAMQLCDMGADVIKIEPPGGDSTRRMAGASGSDSPGFNAVNRGKRGIVLDLKTKGGQDAFRRLVKRSDIVIENYRPGVMRTFGLDYESLAADHPALIYASISGYGQTGPNASKGGFDLVAQGVSGLMSVTGEPGRPPVKVGVPLTDLGAALFALSGVLAALHYRNRTGRGQYIDTSLVEAGIALSVWESAQYFAEGVTPEPLGSAHRMFAPYQAIRCADGYITLGAANDRLFQWLCELLGHPEWITDPDYANDTQRVRNRAALIERIEAITISQSREHWLDAVRRGGHPVRADQRLRRGVRRSAGPRARAWSSTSITLRSGDCGRLARPSRCRRRRPSSAAARRCSASTRGKCCARSASATTRSRRWRLATFSCHNPPAHPGETDELSARPAAISASSNTVRTFDSGLRRARRKSSIGGMRCVVSRARGPLSTDEHGTPLH